MKAIYTCVNRYGNNILYRGYTENGTRVESKTKFKPTFFLKTTKPTEWSALDGSPVESKQFDSMREAKDFQETYSDVSNFKVYGNKNYVAQFIAEKFPFTIDPDLSVIDVGNFDIEVASDEGFPHPEQAAYPVISIAYKSRKSNVYHAWGLGDYNPDADKRPDGCLVQYRKCDSEKDLLMMFGKFWTENTPDVITGWNIRLFDIPYIINRVTRLFGEDVAKNFSPWGHVNYRKVSLKGKTLDAYDIYGVQQMDFYDIFQKFGYTYGTQESYSLDHIAHVVLGERKLSYDEHGSLHGLYKADHQKFISYNIRDVELVDRIDKETGLMDLALTIAYMGGVNYIDVMGTTAIWDSITYRYLNERKIAVPPSKGNPKGEYPGGYVKDPQTGAHDWVVSFDLNSLYPNLIVQYNMSPETIVDEIVYPSGVDHFLDNRAEPKGDYAVAANGTCYSREKQGFLPAIIIDYYNQRRVVKDKMLSIDGEYQKNKSAALATQITQLSNRQMAIKILLNSLYGSLGNAYFRYYDLRIAEGITLSGQLAIRWAEKAVNKTMRNILKTSTDYVIAIDTDSLYVNMNDLVSAVKPSNPVVFLDKACQEKFEPMLTRSYTDMFTHMNAYVNRMEMAREAIADKGIWCAKKRYILNVHNNEGVQYAEPKLKIMGIEAVKSSTPRIVRDKFKMAYKIMLESSESDLQQFVADFYSEFKSLPAEEVSFPRGVSEMVKWSDKTSVYKKGTPIHVRGALLYNHHITRLGLDRENDLLQNGAKVKFCYLKKPNHIHENVISFPAWLPKELQLDQYIDYELQFDKTFKDPLKLVADAIDWNLEEISTLEGFFT